MNLAELKEELIRSGLPSDDCCLTGGLPNEAYCIEKQSDGLCGIYDSERGLKTGLRIFGTEEDACDYFLRISATRGNSQ